MDMLQEPFLRWTLLSTKGRYKYKTLSSYIYYECTRHLNHYIYASVTPNYQPKKYLIVIWCVMTVSWLVCCINTKVNIQPPKSHYCLFCCAYSICIHCCTRTHRYKQLPSYWLVGSSGNDYTHTKSHATAVAAGNSFTSYSIRAEWLV